MSTNSFVNVIPEGSKIPTQVRYDMFVAQLFKPGTEDFMMMHAALGIAGEAGELVDAIKKRCIYGKTLDIQNVIEELGDLRFYMEALCNLLRIDDQEVLQHNANKLADRYKDLTYSDAAAIARKDKNA
jgi:NTP pyrophosphatase (non-canonical NTP hydrolase)